MSRTIIVVAHNIRSSHNIGSLLRTCDGLGVNAVYMTGFTPYPTGPDDKRLPHISRKVHAGIQKTALGAEESVQWHHQENITKLLREFKQKGMVIAALEQSDDSLPLQNFIPPESLVLLLGNEVEGLEKSILRQADSIVEIPMLGKKESFNVVQAAAIALYHFRFS